MICLKLINGIVFHREIHFKLREVFYTQIPPLITRIEYEVHFELHLFP
jgi:hypothetical protein